MATLTPSFAGASRSTASTSSRSKPPPFISRTWAAIVDGPGSAAAAQELGAAPARVGVRARCPAHGRRRRAAWHAVVSLRDVLRLVAAPDDRCEAPSRCGPARPRRTPAHRFPGRAKRTLSCSGPAGGRDAREARPPAAPRRRREPTRLLFFILVCFVLFWCSPRESIEWFVAAMASSFLSGGVVCTLLSRRVRDA